MCRKITTNGATFAEPFNYCQMWASQNGYVSVEMNGTIFVPIQPGIIIQLHAGEYNTQNFVFSFTPSDEVTPYVQIVYTMYDGYDATQM